MRREPVRPSARPARLSFAATAGVLLAGVLLPAPGALGQEDVPADAKVVMVHEEPRHRVVVDEGWVRVLDVQMLPGDTSLYHTHDAPMLYTFVSGSDGPVGGRVSSNTDYFTESRTHRISNEGPHPTRIVAMVHYGPGVDGAVDGLAEGIEREPQLENRWYRSYRFELAPGETTRVHRHRNPVLVVRGTEGRAEVLRDDGFGSRLDGLGRWAWLEPGVSYRLHNPGDASVAVVVNEARRTSGGG